MVGLFVVVETGGNVRSGEGSLRCGGRGCWAADSSIVNCASVKVSIIRKTQHRDDSKVF